MASLPLNPIGLVHILTICCAMDNMKVQWTQNCDVTEQSGNLSETVNSIITLYRQKQQQF